jgi:dolichol-phosphate mannosyltransferase
MQDPPELIPDMVRLWENGNDVVYGKRKKRKGESVFKVLSAKMFYKTLNMLSDVEIPKDTGDFRLVDRKVVDVINNMPEHNKFLRGLFSWCGYRQYSFEYERQKRYAGKTKYPLKKMLKLASDGIFSFSTKPLKLIGTLGVISEIISFGILIYAIVSYFLKLGNLTPGWTSIMVTNTFLGGIILISLRMIGEYIGRIYEEAKGRPQYIVKNTINFDK